MLRDIPERYGPWSTAYDRFRQWRDDGTFDAVLTRLQLQLQLREDGLMDRKRLAITLCE